MTALELERPEALESGEAVVRVREIAQQEALERLCALLEPAPDERAAAPMPRVRWEDRLHRQARLRAARARYVLSTSDVMRRVGPGAWVRRGSRVDRLVRS